MVSWANFVGNCWIRKVPLGRHPLVSARPTLVAPRRQNFHRHLHHEQQRRQHAALVACAAEQRTHVFAGDERGVYGDYLPAV